MDFCCQETSQRRADTSCEISRRRRARLLDFRMPAIVGGTRKLAISRFSESALFSEICTFFRICTFFGKSALFSWNETPLEPTWTDSLCMCAAHIIVRNVKITPDHSMDWFPTCHSLEISEKGTDSRICTFFWNLHFFGIVWNLHFFKKSALLYLYRFLDTYSGVILTRHDAAWTTSISFLSCPDPHSALFSFLLC